MIKNTLQCCYTNASREVGGVISSGWQAVCVSPDLPFDAYKSCTKIQNANSTIQNTMLDENGTVLNLLEFSGDGSYIYVIRTQYGLLDRLGRANMFSHAYIFPCKDSSVSDPNVFLTISNENFKDNEAAAMEEREELYKLPRFEIGSAMQMCGLEQSTYMTLVKSVYAQMSDRKSMRPLYIQYNGTEDILRAILFCIYYALPFSLRRRLSIASVKTENTVGKNIIFSQNARDQELYIDPVTGENTILTARTERRLSRLGFLERAIEFIKIGLSDSGIQQYFEWLEKKAIELGDASGANELVLKIADIQLYSKLYPKLYHQDICFVEDAELDMRLSDALRSNSIGSQAMDRYIASLLDEITSRKLVLTDENTAALRDRTNTSAVQYLSDAVKRYDFYRFNELPVAEAAMELSKMPETMFNQYRAKLLLSENGQEILDYYYAEIVLKRAGLTWEGIREVLDASSDLKVKPLTNDKIDEYAWKLYYDSFAKIKEGNIAYIVSEYNNYLKIMQKKLDVRWNSECGFAAKEAFWDQMTYADIDFDMSDLYWDMGIDSLKCRRMLTYCDLPSTLKSHGETAFFRKANRFFIETKADLGTQYESLIAKVINKAKIVIAEEKIHNDAIKDFNFWCEIFFDTHESDVFDSLLELYECIKYGDLKNVFAAFNSFIKVSNGSSEIQVSQSIAKMLFLKYREWDLKGNPIELDEWLRFGSCLYKNSFQIFDDMRPLILDKDATDVVSRSKLIGERKYQDDAKNYVKEHGREFRTVKKWLTVLSGLERAAENVRKRTREEAPNSIHQEPSVSLKNTQEVPKKRGIPLSGFLKKNKPQ